MKIAVHCSKLGCEEHLHVCNPDVPNCEMVTIEGLQFSEVMMEGLQDENTQIRPKPEVWDDIEEVPQQILNKETSKRHKLHERKVLAYEKEKLRKKEENAFMAELCSDLKYPSSDLLGDSVSDYIPTPHLVVKPMDEPSQKKVTQSLVGNQTDSGLDPEAQEFYYETPKRIPQAEVTLPKNKLTHTTEDVFIYVRGEIKHESFLGRLSTGLGKLLYTLHLAKKQSKSVQQIKYRKNQTYKSVFGSVHGKLQNREVRMDVLSGAGYDTNFRAKVYSDLAKELINTAHSLPRACDAAGVPNQSLLDCMQRQTQKNHPEWYEQADSLIRAMTFAHAQNVRYVADRMMQMTIVKGPIPYGSYDTVPEKIVDKGVIKVEHDKRHTEIVFRDNARFRRGGRGWLPNGMLDHNLPYDSLNEYTTVAGPFFPSDGLALASTPSNVAAMVTRLTNCVKPEIPGFHEMLVNNQDTFFTEEFLDFSIFDTVERKICESLLKRETGMEETVARATNKKALYEHVLQQLKDEGRIHENGGTTLVNEGKQKKEFYQKGATARLFVNLGVPATLSHADTLYKAKTHLASEPIIMKHNGKSLKLVFLAKPKHETLQAWVEDLIAPVHDVTAYIHSDDASFIVKQPNGTIETYNTDISKCDRSHGPRTFATFSRFFSSSPLLHTECMEFVMRAIHLRAKNIPELRAFLMPLLPYLPSGHLYTTLINTFVMMCIAQWFFKSGGSNKEDIINAGNKLGFLLKVHKAERMTDNQLLKHSPCMDDSGYWRPLKNMGVLLRCMGKSDQDYAGSGSVRERARFQNANVLLSFKTGTEIPCLEKWYQQLTRRRHNLKDRSKAQILDKVKHSFEYKLMSDQKSTYSFSDYAVFERYFTPSVGAREFQVLAEQLTRMTVGHHLRSAATSAILSLDYELGEPEEGGWLGDWG
jgi:HPt (histidine-containing phosphotransfer) domain-containing protein